ncbi:hypothetical protein D3C73_1088970 [compost metagenome]
MVTISVLVIVKLNQIYGAGGLLCGDNFKHWLSSVKLTLSIAMHCFICVSSDHRNITDDVIPVMNVKGADIDAGKAHI